MTIQIAPYHSFVYDGTQINIYHANKGEGLPKHEHTFAHATMVGNGSCILRKENLCMTFDKSTQPINLKENEWHEIEAFEDNTVFINMFALEKETFANYRQALRDLPKKTGFPCTMTLPTEPTGT